MILIKGKHNVHDTLWIGNWHIHLGDKQWITSLGFIILLLRNSGCFPCSHNNDWKKKMSLPSLPYAISKHPFSHQWLKCCLTRTPSYFFIYYMFMNVLINILFVAHLRHNMPQLLGRKIFTHFFHLPLTCLRSETQGVKLSYNLSQTIHLL